MGILELFGSNHCANIKPSFKKNNKKKPAEKGTLVLLHLVQMVGSSLFETQHTPIPTAKHVNFTDYLKIPTLINSFTLSYKGLAIALYL